MAVVSIKKQYPGHAKRVMMGVWSFLRQFMYTKFIVIVDEDVNTRDWKEVIWAITTRMDPVRDTTLIEHTPIDYLDFASPISGLGGKMGLDATNKLPGKPIANGVRQSRWIKPPKIKSIRYGRSLDCETLCAHLYAILISRGRRTGRIWRPCLKTPIECDCLTELAYRSQLPILAWLGCGFTVANRQPTASIRAFLPKCVTAVNRHDSIFWQSVSTQSFRLETFSLFDADWWQFNAGRLVLGRILGMARTRLRTQRSRHLACHPMTRGKSRG